MRKTLYVFGAIVVVAAGLAWYFVTYRMDAIIESRVERLATASFGAAVEIGGVKTDLRNGTLTVEQFSVANPPGFTAPHAVKLNNIEAALDYDTREIKRVIVDNPEFFIEEMNGETNFGRMLEELENSQPAPAGQGDAAPEPVFTIHQFRINQTRATFDSRSLDRYTDLEVDAIELNDLRGTPTELAEIIAREVVKELSNEAAVEVVKGQAGKQLDKLGDDVSGVLKGLLGVNEDKEPETEPDQP